MAGCLSHSLEGSVRLYNPRLYASQEVDIHVFKIEDIEFFDSSWSDGLIICILVELFCFRVKTVYFFTFHFIF